MMKLVPGMLDGARNARAVPNGEAVCWFTPRETDDIELGALKLTDRATFLLALDELARRVGLDPAGGVVWTRMSNGWWVLDPGNLVKHVHFFTPSGQRHTQRSVVPGVDTDDPTAALRAALEATEPMEQP